MAYITNADVTDWAPGPFTGLDADVLTACVEAACRAIEEFTGRLFTPTTGRVRYFDGDTAYGKTQHLLVLEPSDAPVRTVTTVQENGSTLSVASGYSTAQVLTRNLGLEEPCYLVRQDGHTTIAWAAGVQNIRVVYDCGPADLASVHPVAIHAAKELSWLMFKEGRRTGVLATAKGGGGGTYLKDLPASTLRALQAMQRWRTA